MHTRIFAPTDTNLKPSQLAAKLDLLGIPVEPHFKGDDLGWTTGTLKLVSNASANGSPIQLERWLTEEDNLREDLNTYAAELETMDFNPHHAKLMELVIQAKQLIILRKPIDHADDAKLSDAMQAITEFFAQGLHAIYQIDHVGWHSPQGELLLPEY